MSRFRTFAERALVAAVLIEGVLCVGLVGFFAIRGPVHHSLPPRIASKIIVQRPAKIIEAKITYGLPVRLKIPKIGVDAALDYVGLTHSGALDTPKGPTDAAWFDLGPRPGDAGNAVIDGHFGWTHNIPAVFDNLHKLQPGDAINVVDDKGATISFIVRELRVYGENEDDSSIFYAADGSVHLNLITCQGSWSELQKSYSSRLVVFADEIP